MTRRRYHSLDEINRALALIKDGYSIRAAAREIGVARSTVRGWLANPDHHAKLAKRVERDARIVSLARTGQKYQTIADTARLSRSRVMVVARRHGIRRGAGSSPMSDELREHIHAMLDAGMSLTGIAKLVGYTTTTIRRVAQTKDGR